MTSLIWHLPQGQHKKEHVRYLELYSKLLNYNFNYIEGGALSKLTIKELSTYIFDKNIYGNIVLISGNVMINKNFKLEQLKHFDYINQMVYAFEFFELSNFNENMSIDDVYSKHGNQIFNNDYFIYDFFKAQNTEIIDKYVFNFPLYLFRYYDDNIYLFMMKYLHNRYVNWVTIPYYVHKTFETYYNVPLQVNIRLLDNQYMIPKIADLKIDCNRKEIWVLKDPDCDNIQNIIQKYNVSLIKYTNNFNWYDLCNSLYHRMHCCIYKNNKKVFDDSVNVIQNMQIKNFYIDEKTSNRTLSWVNSKNKPELMKCEPYYATINKLFYQKRIDECAGVIKIMMSYDKAHKMALLKKSIGCMLLLKASANQISTLLKMVKFDDYVIITQLIDVGYILKSTDIITEYLNHYVEYIQNKEYSVFDFVKIVKRLTTIASLKPENIITLWEKIKQHFRMFNPIEPTIKLFLDYVLNSNNSELYDDISRFLEFYLNINITLLKENIDSLQTKYPIYTYHKLLYIDPYPTDPTYFIKRRKEVSDTLDFLLERFNVKVTMNDILYYSPHNFFFSYHGESSKDIFAKYYKLLSKICPELNYRFVYKPNVNKKTKIGFLSAHFNRWHSVFKDRHQVVKHLAKNPNNEVIIFYYEDFAPDVINTFDKCKKIQCPRDLLKIRNIISRENLDVLVYPEIGMDKYTYFTAFSKLARYQINTWGHSDTSGIGTIDYFISSVLFEKEKEEAQEHYSEKLVLMNSLSTCYINPVMRYNKSIEEFALQMKPRNQLGFSQQVNIYFCLQSLFKINPVYDDYLNQILLRDPKAMILLMDFEKKERLIQRLEPVIKHNMSRIHWLRMCEHKQYMNYMYISDVVLDTYPFGGCNSSLEAFSMGKPVVTQPSNMINGRFTYGFYKRMNIFELVSKDKEEYINNCVKLCTDNHFKRQITRKILQNNKFLFSEQASLNEWETFISGLAK